MNDIVRFGSEDTFAVHLKLGMRIRSDCFGNLCYWIGGKMVGDFAADIRLGDVQGQMNYIIKDSGHRYNEHLFSARCEDVFYSLDTSLYSGAEARGGHLIELPEQFAVFEGTITGQSFDFWKVFVIDGVKTTKILYARYNDQNISCGTSWKDPGKMRSPHIPRYFSEDDATFTIPTSDIFSQYGDARYALIYSTIFFRKFIEIDGSILLKQNITNDTADRFSTAKKKAKLSLSSVEVSFNTVEVIYIFRRDNISGDAIEKNLPRSYPTRGEAD